MIDNAAAERRITIGFTGSATYDLLPGITRTLAEDFPELRLGLKGEMLTPAQVDALRSGKIDIGLLRPPVHADDVAVHLVRTEPLIAVLPAAHRLAQNDAVRLAELRDDPFVAYPSHFTSVVHDAVEEACGEAGFAPRTAVEVAETATLVAFVAGGLGVALVPASAQRLQIAGAVYRPLAGNTREVELALAVRADDPDPAREKVVHRIYRLIGGPRPVRS
ncbi:LysR family substrate-binding domain-containing protein [Tomitella fengzijianii]|uniref:LysR family transcriptional regulator n=1 Tax=Tomitella fengzijianii TaxID=2597660 RepID=A0A516X597_9ACTN|nr:LysR family substrate-binding domain-containing protein [Tomitella fengzijianii]QDQ98220.1 LysR family transcriptional regulator [Tomitella fengzijianii]